MALNRAGLVELVQKNLGKETTKAAAERALTAVLTAIKAGTKKDKAVQLIGFGTFKVVTRKARKGINPKTRKPITIKASKTVKFVAGAEFKKSI